MVFGAPEDSGADCGSPSTLRESALPPSNPTKPARRLCPRPTPMSVLRSAGGKPRSCSPPLTRRRPHLGERRGRLSAVQCPQGRQDTGRSADGTVGPATGAETPRVDPDRTRVGSTSIMGCLPRDGRLISRRCHAGQHVSTLSVVLSGPGGATGAHRRICARGVRSVGRKNRL